MKDKREGKEGRQGRREGAKQSGETERGEGVGEQERKQGNALLNVKPAQMSTTILNPLCKVLLFYGLLHSISQNILLHTPRALQMALHMAELINRCTRYYSKRLNFFNCRIKGFFNVTFFISM